LLALSSGYTVLQIKEEAKTSLVYVIPLNSDLDKTPLDVNNFQNHDVQLVKCHTCQKEVPLISFQNHKSNCKTTEFEENKEESVADTIQKLQILFPQHDKEYLNTVFSGSIHINEAVEKILKEMNNLEHGNKNLLEETDIPGGSGNNDLVESDSSNSDHDSLPDSGVGKKIKDQKLKWESFKRRRNLKKGHVLVKINRDTILLSTMTLFKRGDIKNISIPPEVKFQNEDGIDATGPRKEYFFHTIKSFLSGEKNIVLFEGREDRKVPVHDTDLLASDFFYYAGKFVAMAFFHGEIGIWSISPCIQEYILSGSKTAAIALVEAKDVADLETQSILESIKKACTEEDFADLNGEDGILSLLNAAGFVNKMLGIKTKDQAYQEILFYEVITKRREELDDFRRGMNEDFQLVNFVYKNRSLQSKLFPKLKDFCFSKEQIINCLSTPPNLTEKQITAFNYLKKFLEEDLNNDDLVKKFLLFVTGYIILPAKINVKFFTEGRKKYYPDPDTCFNSLTLPLDYEDLKDFKKRMDTVLDVQASGYGRW
uniref:HECT domain-containing protein n=2 Tax=Clytia hemisphaerica TaxID=252671 RepID=A0A7M5XKV0_9CNID